MIGRLLGTLLAKDDSMALVDVAGVGYEVEISTATLYALPAIGEEAVLHTHYIVREDAHLLFGFTGLAERNLFRLLIKANGVGPRLALGMLAGLAADKLAGAIVGGDVATLVKVPGIGRKTAERLVLELKDKASQWLLQHRAEATIPRLPAAQSRGGALVWQEAEAGLVALGYKPQEAARQVAAAASSLEQQGKEADTESLIRAALKMSL